MSAKKMGISSQHAFQSATAVHRRLLHLPTITTMTRMALAGTELGGLILETQSGAAAAAPVDVSEKMGTNRTVSLPSRARLHLSLSLESL